jgi:hypothetical protein
MSGQQLVLTITVCHDHNTLLQKQKGFPSMDGNGTPESVNFVEVSQLFHAYTKLTLSCAFFPWTFNIKMYVMAVTGQHRCNKLSWQ